MTEGAPSPSSNEFWEVICHHDYLTSHSSFEQNTGPNNDILPNLAKEPQFPNENSYERIKRLKILQSQSILPILLIIAHP